ncbi:PepSY domain-containing protein [Candidatus Woesearchaeota archaeon]|nr:PepSY domain-containing protein [Candidatus Woesearchaeota archaeon]
MAAAKRSSGLQGTVSSLVGAVENTGEFSEWRRSNANAFLSSMFCMVAEAGQLASAPEWLLSYYDAADDTFTTFSTLGGQKATKEQAFKKGRALPQLNTKSVKIGIKGCIKLAEGVRSRKYEGESPTRIIAILQPLTPIELAASGTSSRSNIGSEEMKEIKTVWNITYINASYNVLNIKIDAETGKVLADSISGVMDFMQKD